MEHADAVTLPVLKVTTVMFRVRNCMHAAPAPHFAVAVLGVELSMDRGFHCGPPILTIASDALRVRMFLVARHKLAVMLVERTGGCLAPPHRRCCRNKEVDEGGEEQERERRAEGLPPRHDRH